MSDLQFAATDPDAYQAQAHQMLNRANVPRRHRLFDHSRVVQMVAVMAKEPQADSTKGN